MWDLLGPRIEPVSSALTGRFTTPGPRGKLYVIFHTDIISLTDSDPWPGLPWCFSGKTNKQTKKTVCQDRRPGFHPWVRMIPLSRKWQPAPVFLLGKFHRQRSLALLQLMGWQRVGCNLMAKQQQQKFLALGWHFHSGVWLIETVERGLRLKISSHYSFGLFCLSECPCCKRKLCL